MRPKWLELSTQSVARAEMARIAAPLSHRWVLAVVVPLPVTVAVAAILVFFIVVTISATPRRGRE